MIVAAFIPPLWRAIMDKRVLAYYDGDISRANIHPPVREKYLARYPRPSESGSLPAR
jgi:alkane 1-monooxygenase